MSPEEEQEHCKLDLIVQELNLVVTEQGKSRRSPAERNNTQASIHRKNMQKIAKSRVIEDWISNSYKLSSTSHTNDRTKLMTHQKFHTKHKWLSA